MSDTSRRRLLAAFAASAAAQLTGLAAAPVRAAAAVDVPAFPGPAGLSSARSWVTMAPLDASYFSPVALATPLTTTVLAGPPVRTEVTSGGKRVALLTHGARTVVLPGPQRTFAENKRPFVDDFQRTLPDLALLKADRVHWGASPGGGRWSTSEDFKTDFSVVPGTGIIDLTTDKYSRHASLRDDEITDVDVRCTAGFDKVPTGQACSFALTFGYVNTQSHYRARLSFLTSGAVEMRLEKEVENEVTALGAALTLATGVRAGADWTIRVRREGTRIQAKAWPSASAEPSSWAFDRTDSTPMLIKGRVGLRALANDGCTNLPVRLSVSRLEVDAANWAVLPTVAHGDWVRLLPEPFDGTWTAELERTIRGWAGSIQLNGYPKLTIQDEDHTTVDGVRILRGTDQIGTGIGGDGSPQPVVLRPGEAAVAGLAWRNTTQAGEPVNAPYVRVWATPAADPVMVVPELDLGTTGKLGVGPWRKDETYREPASAPAAPTRP